MKYALNGTWKLTYCEFGQGKEKGYFMNDQCTESWYDAKVPGDVHLDLAAAGVIGEPFELDNAPKCKWMESKEWWYRIDFDISEAFIGDRLEITFEGLDTVAEIWLNGEKIGEHNNALIPYTIDITGSVHSEKNTLAVRLECGARVVDHKEYKKYGGFQGEYFGWRSILRKPQFVNGWDWAPHLLTCGIWRSVSICSYKDSTIRDIYLTDKVSNTHAIITASVEVENFLEQETEYKLIWSLVNGETFTESIPVVLNKGVNQITGQIKIASPRLWWPAPIGNPDLYNVSVVLRKKSTGQIVDEYKTRHGIREIRILQEPTAEGGKSFTIEVNGIKVYAKGANWVPADGITARVSKNKYIKLIQYAREANFNILRVWGGGIYEDPIFYNLCDENGIMIWQDFMYACIFYADDDMEFMQEAEREARLAVKRLRSHPSVVLWSGNNEIDQTYYSMTTGGIEWFKQSFFPIQKFFGEKIFHELLPSVCSELDHDRPYWPSSPYSGDGEDPNLADLGDRHSWDNGYRNYIRDTSRFTSEYGIMSAPPLKSVAEYLKGQPVELDSELWKFHSNTTDPDNRTIKEALREYYKDPENMKIEEYILASQWVQGEALKNSFEHYRRRKYTNSGTMFWMYNDSWGTVGWTIVDYYLRKKASFYFVKRGYYDVLTSIMKEKDGKFSVWVINDLLKEINGRLEVSKIAFDGSREEKIADIDVNINENISQKCLEYCLPEVEKNERNYYFYTNLTENNVKISENWYFINEWKQLEIPLCHVKYKIENVKGNVYTFSCLSDSFCQLLHIDEEEIESIADNAFYLNPGKEKRVEFILKQNGDAGKIKVSGINTLFREEKMGKKKGK